MGMHHSFSGKQSYNYYESEGGLPIPRDELEEIVKKEDMMRCSEEWQAKFAKRDSNQWRVQVCHQLQSQALTESGIQEADLDAALITLRSHRSVYRDDPDFYKPVYVKYDRSTYMDWTAAAHDGSPPCLAPPPPPPPAASHFTGDELPCHLDLALHDLDGSFITLLEVLARMEGVPVPHRDWYGDAPSGGAPLSGKAGAAEKGELGPAEVPAPERFGEAYLWGRSKPCVLLAGSLT